MKIGILKLCYLICVFFTALLWSRFRSNRGRGQESNQGIGGQGSRGQGRGNRGQSWRNPGTQDHRGQDQGRGGHVQGRGGHGQGRGGEVLVRETKVSHQILMGTPVHQHPETYSR